MWSFNELHLFIHFFSTAAFVLKLFVLQQMSWMHWKLKACQIGSLESENAVMEKERI